MENLIKIQNELKVPKGNFNSFGKYKYRSCEDILEAVKPLLKKYNCTLNLSDDIVSVGNKVFLKATATIKDAVVSECASGFAETSEHKGMSAEQTTGTASSYARKYALNGLFLIDETEQDADNEAIKPKETKAPEFVDTTSDKKFLNKFKYQTTEITPEWEKVVKAIGSHDYSIADVEKKYKLGKEIKAELIQIQQTGI